MKIVAKPAEVMSNTLKQVAYEAASMPPSDRRAFLKKGMMFVSGAAVVTSTAGVAATPPNIPQSNKVPGFGVVTYPYGQPSQYEKHVVRRNVPWLTADTISSVSFTPIADLYGIITPNGLVFERHHAGVPDINPDEYRLMIHGLVDRPIVLTLDDIMRYPSTSVVRFIECPANGGMEWRGPQMEALQFTHGMLSCCEWTGVPLKTILADVGLQPEGKWILAEGADGAAMTRSIPMEKALDDALIVYAQNGEKLRRENGYPVRLLNPGWEGNTNIKWLRRLEIGDKPWHHREETSKYTDLVENGKARRFTWVQQSNSVITSPCPEKPWNMGKGWYEIQGLAWSGAGTIKGVDISLDGGKSWQSAYLKGLVLPKALTRFGMMFQWDGQPLLLQSRSHDSSGYVQPTITQLRQSRGKNSIYHKNSIHTWKLLPTGEVKNVQVV